MNDDTEPPYREDYEDLTEDEMKAQYERLIADRNLHPEFTLYQAWTSLWRSFDIYTGNAFDLRALLVASETDEDLQTELFQNVRAPTVRDAFFRGLDRTLHNALASAVSLVDHTRRHVAVHFPKTDFSREFESRNTAVYEMPESAFLRRFRNYLLHVGHAPFTMTGSFAVKEGDRGTLTIWLDAAALLDVPDDVWTAPARTFIEDHPDGIHLLAAFDRYVAAMDDLYIWVFNQQPVLSPNGLDILNDFTRRINLTMTAGSHDGRHMEEFWQHVADNAQAAEEGREQTDWQDVKPKDEPDPS